MKAKTKIIALLLATFALISCQEFLDEALKEAFLPHIESAKFGEDFSTIYVYYDGEPENPEIKIEVRKIGGSWAEIGYDILGYYPYARPVKFVLNREIPKGYCVIIEPADGNEKLLGYYVLERPDNGK